jgi:membrane associated rhomboid family serine protease
MSREASAAGGPAPPEPTALEVALRPHVAWMAHLGGFAAGAAVAVPMRWLPVPTESARFEAHVRVDR